MRMAGFDQAQVRPIPPSRALIPLRSGYRRTHDLLLQGWLSAPSAEYLLLAAGRHGAATSAMLQVRHCADDRQAAEPDVLTRPHTAIGHCHGKEWLGCHEDDEPESERIHHAAL